MIESQSPSSDPSIVALIPARSGSKRVPGKNIRRFGNHPLIAYTIASAPKELSGDKSPDIEWVEDLLRKLRSNDRDYDCFSLLRPTSPMRTAKTIQRAWVAFLDETGVDSLRAVETVRQHPGKMWVVRGRRMFPLLPYGPAEQPWHSSQYQSLPVIHVQNASLEIAWTRVVFEGRTIAGEAVMPFVTEADEGVDINDAEDWMHAEQLVTQAKVLLPEVSVDRFEPK